MKRKIIAPALGVSSLLVSSMALADTQTILPIPAGFNVSPGDSVQFSVSYPAGNPEATGLGVTLYFDSSKLEFVETSNVLSTPSLHQAQAPVADSDNADDDADTDQKIVVAFSNFTSDPFVATEEMPVNLFTVTFTTKDDFSSASGINFTGKPALGHTFASTPVSIAYNETDTTVPSITAPADVSIDATGISTQVSSTDLGDPIVSDNIDASPSVSYSPQGPFALGMHTITWTVTDSSGNQATDEQIITIQDVNAPVISAPEDISTPATGELTAVTLGTPSVNDNTDANPLVSADSTGPFLLGTHTITWTAIDAAGNSSKATQTVTITDPDTLTLIAPADITQEATGPDTPVILEEVSTIDVIDGKIIATADNTGPFSVGVHTITWTITNSRNTSVEAIQTVTITDTTVPVITVPAAQTIEATGEKTSVNLGSATANDLVDGFVSAASGSIGPLTLGTHIVTWTATDTAGNTATAKQTIIVEDTTAPDIQAPADQSVSATGDATSVQLGTPIVSDLVDANPSVGADKTGPFNVGTHTVTWTATDNQGNSATATQTVTISPITRDVPPLGLVAAETINHNWTPIAIGALPDNFVLITAPPSFHGKQPGVVRVHRTAAGEFEMRFQEWDYLDGQHKNEIVPYLVLEKGRHTMSDGSIWEAGTLDLGGTGQWQTGHFLQAFTEGVPRLLLTAQSANGNQTTTVRAKNVTQTGFEAALFEQEALMDGHKTETIAYLAIYSARGSGSIDLGAKTLPYNLQQQVITHQWQPVLGSTLMVEEEQSADAEIWHKGEDIDLLGLGAYVFAQDVSSRGLNSIALRQKPFAGNSSLEWGRVSGVTHQWSTIPLQNSYTNPVVVAYQGTPQDADLAVVAIRNVNGDSFQTRIQEWNYLDGQHLGAESIHYLVVEAGQQTLGGLKIQAGLVNSHATIDNYEQVNFTEGFSESPAVFSSVINSGDTDTVITRINQVKTSGFDLAIQAQEALQDGHGLEDVSWIAITQGQAEFNDRWLEVSQLATNHTEKKLTFTAKSSDFPVVLGHMNTVNGNNTALARPSTLSATAVEFKVQEEQSKDEEINHTIETISVFVAE